MLAPRSALRHKVIPPRPPDRAQLELFNRNGKPTAHAQCDPSPSAPKLPTLPKSQRIAWARLLKRMGGYDMETCPDCGQALSIVSAVLEPHAIRRALALRGLLDPIPELTRSPSRGPPAQLPFDFVSVSPDGWGAVRELRDALERFPCPEPSSSHSAP